MLLDRRIESLQPGLLSGVSVLEVESGVGLLDLNDLLDLDLDELSLGDDLLDLDDLLDDAWLVDARCGCGCFCRCGWSLEQASVNGDAGCESCLLRVRADLGQHGRAVRCLSPTVVSREWSVFWSRLVRDSLFVVYCYVCFSFICIFVTITSISINFNQSRLFMT